MAPTTNWTLLKYLKSQRQLRIENVSQHVNNLDIHCSHRFGIKRHRYSRPHIWNQQLWYAPCSSSFTTRAMGKNIFLKRLLSINVRVMSIDLTVRDADCCFSRFFIFYNGIVNQMASNLNSFTEDRVPLCETLSPAHANSINATAHEMGFDEVSTVHFSSVRLIYLSVDIHAWNQLIWFNFSFQKDCVAKLELETLFANISLEIMCGVLMGVINVALRYVGKFWILCAWYLLRFFFRLLFVHSSMRSSFHWHLSYYVILIRI